MVFSAGHEGNGADINAGPVAPPRAPRQARSAGHLIHRDSRESRWLRGGARHHARGRAARAARVTSSLKRGSANDLILTRFGGQSHYAAIAVVWALDSASIGLT